MSLVTEALRKARLEAARQEARRRGVPPPVGPQPQPRRGPGAGWIVAALAVVLLAAGGIFWAGRRSAAPAATETVATAPATPPVEEPSAAAPAPDLAPPAAPAAAPPSTRDAATPRAEAAPPPANEPTAAPPNAPAATPAPRATASAPRPPDAQTVREPDEDGKPVYVRGVDSAAGRLELGGIAFSQDRPFALINGQVVGPGDRLLGHQVVAVRPDSVELEGPDGVFLLRLR